MTLFWIILLGLAIGLILGGLGGGGAILTVPALVYVVGQPVQASTISSLVIVGLSALVGALSYIASGKVLWRISLAFGAVGLPTAWLGTYLNQRVDEDILLLGFAVLMVMAAAAMMADRLRPSSRGGRHREETSRGRATPDAAQTRPATKKSRSSRGSPIPLVCAALAVGFVTGFLGVGGGFVIVPVLVLALRLPVQVAVGTSLTIVAFNSATSLASRATSAQFDWHVIVPFALTTMVATLVGKAVASRVPTRQLNFSFAILLVVVASFTGWQSFMGLSSGS